MIKDAKLAILICTFLRDDKMAKCINSILENCKVSYKIYLSDSGIQTKEKDILYNRLKSQGHKVLLVPFDFPPQVARNHLISKMTEAYVLKIDDDFLIDEDTKISEMVELMDKNMEIDLLGMCVKSPDFISKYIFDISINEMNNDWLMDNHGSWTIHTHESGLKYHFCDLTPDCFIARREIFPDCNWDENYHVGEGMHADFFFQIKFSTNYKVAYCPNSIMKHQKHCSEQDSLVYRHMRHRKAGNEIKLRRKWNIATLNRRSV